MSKKPPKVDVDPVIMAELLEQPDVKRESEKLMPEMMDWFKDLLVKQGIYQQYVKERERK